MAKEGLKRRCCGMDVHKNSVSVCILPAQGQKEEWKRRNFPTFTRDLKQLRNWLKKCGVTEIAMESTGQYWRPLWNLLEGEFEKLLLVNPQHIKGLDGRKTDRRDAQWIAELLEDKRLKGSWVPPREIRELRDLTRQRVHTQEDLTRVRNRIEQVCQSGNIKVSSVASDLFGKSGRCMLKALVEGKRDAGWMADYACGTLRNKKHELEAALEGTFTAEQRWLLGRELQQMEWLEQQVAAMEQETEQRVIPFSEPLRRLMTIPGVDRITAWTILAEVGADARAFEDARHLASWAGLCPGNRESGGKRMSGRTRKANCYVKRALCQAAWAASHTKNTYLSAFYRRLCVRKGAPKAVMALAHHLITIVYHVLARQEEYTELGGDYYDRRNKTKVVNRLVKRLAVLGYEVTLNPSRPLEFDEEVHAVPPWISSPALDGSAPTITSSKPKRGRPCKCTERGIICIHGRLPEAKSLIDQPPTRVEFS
jgi:transposase